MPTREQVLADTFVTLADTLVDDFDVVEVLTLLSTRCVELLEAAATGIMLGDERGRLQVMAASSEAANLLELFQAQNDEGPCLEAFVTGRPVTCADLNVTPRWPRFSAMALAADLPSVHAFPMALRGRSIGTLNLFMSRAQPLPETDVLAAQALAHAATIALLQNQASIDTSRVAAQLQTALNSRVAIEQAKGVLSEQASIGVDEAFERLRSYARSHKAKLTDVAVAVVNHSLASAEHGELTRQPEHPVGG